MRLKYIIFLLIITIQGNLFGQANEIGKINIGEKIEIFSEVLHDFRTIYVYQPKGFWGTDEQVNNLPVVYVLDGESQFLNTVSTIDYLSSAPLGIDKLPRCIIVGIPNKNRNRDLTPIKGKLGNDPSTIEETGGGPQFLEFITSELIPHIDSSYATCDHRTIIGHSLGGLLAFEALLTKRDYFNNYVAIDPGFGFAYKAYLNTVLDTLNNADLKDENLFFAAANTRPSFLSLEEMQDDMSDIITLIDKPNQELINSKASKDWQINMSMKYYDDENHFSVPHRATYDAMKYFYDFYSFNEMNNYYHPKYSDSTDIVSKIKEHYAQISEKMGCEFIPMEGYIISFALGLNSVGRQDLSIDLFNYNIELYPDRPNVYNSFGYYLHEINHIREAIEQFDKSLKLEDNEYIVELRSKLHKELIEQNK